MKSWRPAFRPQLETVEDRLPPGSLLSGDATGHSHDELLSVVGLLSGMNVMGANFNVLPPNANASYPNGPGATHPYGQTYGQWAADWWVREFTESFGDPSQLDTGANSPGQSGSKVTLLEGTFDSTPASYDYTVSPGTPVFFPIANSVYLQFPSDDPQLSVDQMRALVKGPADDISNMSVTIDGIGVNDLAAQRVQSSVFQLTNIPSDSLAAALGVPAGSVGVDDGYYVMLRPLSVGPHTIHVGASIPAENFTIDVTYHISVAPGSH